MAKYGKKAQAKVREALHEMQQGELKSGGSGTRVTDPKQAIAIGLSEARREGAKAPSHRASAKSRATTSKSTSGSRSKSRASSARKKK